MRWLLALLLALYAPAAAAATVQPLLGGSTGNLSTTVTQYGVLGTIAVVTNTADSTDYPPAPSAGTIGNLYVVLTVAPGAGTSRTITIKKNNSNQTLTCTVSDAATTCNDTSHTFSVTAGDVLSWTATLSGSVVAGIVHVSVTFTPTVANDTMILARIGTPNTGATAYGVIPQGTSSAWTTTQANAQSLIPDAGSFTALYASLSAVPGAAKSFAFTLDKNTVAGALTCTVSGNAATTCNDTSHTVDPAAGDALDISSVPSGTPTAAVPAFGLKFVPTTSGDFVFMSTASSADSNSAVNILPPNGRTTPTGTGAEATNQQVASVAFTATAIYVSTTDPGGSASRAFTLRKNGSNTALTCTVNHGTTTCNATGGSVAISVGDLISTGDAPTGTPATGSPLVGLVGFITPSGGGGTTTRPGTLSLTGAGR
jgi:hypothetical protein